VAEHDPIAERVADLSTSFVMTSGAGCGKTYRMVQRYTAIIEAGHDVTRIIAVTFTEKAAAELKSRVREKCREMMAQTEGEERAVWERAARRLAMAPVTTIHGLCARLLRENAIAAGIDPHFRQLDETEQSLLLRDALRRTLLNRVHAGEASAQRAGRRRWRRRSRACWPTRWATSAGRPSARSSAPSRRWSATTPVIASGRSVSTRRLPWPRTCILPSG